MKEVKSKSTSIEAQKPMAIGYVPIHYVEKSRSVQSNFFRFLSTLLGNYYGSKSQEVLNRLLDEYRLGATRDGSVIFWQIDKNGKVRTGNFSKSSLNICKFMVHVLLKPSLENFEHYSVSM